MASGLTPNYSLPYPISTDPVNVHGDVKLLSDRLDVVLPIFPREDVENTFTQSNIFEVNSSSTALRITQVGSGNALLVEDANSPDSTPVVITNTGKIGIGKLSPSSILDVSGNATLNADLTTTIPLTVKGAASQSANLQEWQDSSGTSMVSVTSSGELRAVLIDGGNA